MSFPKAPVASQGKCGIDNYRSRLLDHECSLRNKLDRAFYRKELGLRAKRYKTLATQRSTYSSAAIHFHTLAQLHQEMLDGFGDEPPRKPRRKWFEHGPLVYPSLPERCIHRAHFATSGSLRRERSAALSVYADAVVKQIAPDGSEILSVGIVSERVQLFERLVESIGADGLHLRSNKNGGFYGYTNSKGRRITGLGWEDPDSPWRRMGDDNFQAKLYHWSMRRGVLDASIALPDDCPDIPESLPWDPDPRFGEILELTQADRLVDALKKLHEIPSTEREVLYDEVIYLKYLLGETLRGDDLRHIARKYISISSISPRLEEQFEDFIVFLDGQLADAGPIPDSFPGLAYKPDLLQTDPNPVIRDTPALSDWKATREHYYTAFHAFGHPIRPRGRIFVWNPDITFSSKRALQGAFSPELRAAEDTFRRARSIAEIGRGWASETALFDLVREMYPSAVHQWRPTFLGMQSIDIYIPSLNLAIEYQGEQHYRAIDRFGGEEGLAATESRDARKRALLKSNGVQLLEWRYDRPLYKEEVDSALREFKLE